MTHDDDDETPQQRKRRERTDAKKERVLHTRVPDVLDRELKRLAKNLRVPVSNVVRAILEDAVDAVDTVSERAEGGLIGFVERLSEQRTELRNRVTGDETGDETSDDEDGDANDATDAEPAEGDAADETELFCPEALPEVLEGVFGYQPLVLAAETPCDVCGRVLPAGSEAHRALFDEPGRKVFLGSGCRLLPGKVSGS